MNEADLTGFGPSSAGNAPSPAEARRHAANKAFAEKINSAMQYHDPQVMDMAMAALRLKTGLVDPAELRQKLYNSREGQFALDTAMGTKNYGIFGNGSSADAAMQYASVALGGGFAANVRDGKGNMMGANQQVSGNGILSERMAMHFQENLMQGMGASTNGFNRTDMSKIFREVYGKSGVGNIGTMQYDADVDTRFSSMRQSSSPDIRRQLTALGADGRRMTALREAESNFKNGGSQGQLDSYLETISDPKERSAVSQVIRSKDAFTMNDQSSVQAGRTMKEVAKGLAAVSEIYPELQDISAKMQKLKSMTGGGAIIDPTTAKKATQMMNNIIQGAPEGMDRRAWADTVMNSNAQWRGSFFNATGLDGRSDSEVTAASAAQNTRWNSKAAFFEQANSATRQNLNGVGVKVGSRNYSEILADEQQGGLTFMSQRKGIVTLQGAIESGMLPPDNAKAAQALMDQYNSATSARERASIDARAKSLLGGAAGYDAWSKSGTASRWLTDGAASYAMSEAQNKERREALNYQNMNDVTGSEKMSRSVIRTLGHRGLADVGAMARGGSNKAQVRSKLLENGMTEEEADAFIAKNINASGGLSDSANYNQLIQTAETTDRNNTSEYDQRAYATDRMRRKGEGDYRKVVDGNGGGLTGILKGLMGGSIKDDAELAPVAIEALRKEGIDIKGGYESGINIEKGVDDKSLASIAKASGLSELAIANKAGYGSVAEMKAATTKDPQKLSKFRDMLEVMPGMNVTGTMSSMNIASDEIMENYNKGDYAKRMRAVGAYEFMNPGLSSGEMSETKKAILEGTTTGMSLAPEVSKFEKGGWFGAGGTDRMDNLGKFRDMTSRLNNASDAEIAAINEADPDGNTLKNLESQRAEIQKAMDAGKTTMKSKDANGVEMKDGISLNATLLAGIDAAISKMKGNKNTEVATMIVKNAIFQGPSDFSGKKENLEGAP